jgi:ribose 5-phosphate isomerase B
MLYLAADHAGFQLKEKIKKYLEEQKIAYEDVGAFEFNKNDDYPDFAYAAAHKIAVDPEKNRGILICGSGAGMSITANKAKGVYCAQVWQRDLARSAREHNNVNAIALGARYIDEHEAILSIEEFLKAEGKTEERHKRRFEKVKEIEDKSIRGL